MSMLRICAPSILSQLLQNTLSFDIDYFCRPRPQKPQTPRAGGACYVAFRGRRHDGSVGSQADAEGTLGHGSVPFADAAGRTKRARCILRCFIAPIQKASTTTSICCFPASICSSALKDF